MKFYSLTANTTDYKILEEEYKNAREIGIIRIGETCLFFRKRLKKYYITYNEMSRCFRRVMSVPAKLCCGKGEFIIENLVVWSGDKEIAEIQLPGTKAARILIDELKQKAPNVLFSCPEEKTEAAEENV